MLIIAQLTAWSSLLHRSSLRSSRNLSSPANVVEECVTNHSNVWHSQREGPWGWGVGAHSLPFCLNPSLALFLQPQPKYFHSAAILDDLMVVFGGRSDTNDQLFSDQFLVYNVKCNHWQILSGMIVLAFHITLYSAHTRAARVRRKLPLHRGYCRKKNHWDRHRLATSQLLYSAYGTCKRGSCSKSIVPRLAGENSKRDTKKV